MLDINASAEGVFVFISQNPQCFFIDSPQAPFSGPTTHTILAAGRLPAPVQRAPGQQHREGRQDLHIIRDLGYAVYASAHGFDSR